MKKAALSIICTLLCVFVLYAVPAWDANTPWQSYTVGDQYTHNSKTWEVTNPAYAIHEPGTEYGAYGWVEVDGGTVVTSVNKVIVDAPLLADETFLNVFCNTQYSMGHNNYWKYAGVCEAPGKLTVAGEVEVKVNNRHATATTFPAGTQVKIGDWGYYAAGYIDLECHPDWKGEVQDKHFFVGVLPEETTIQPFEYKVIKVVLYGGPRKF